MNETKKTASERARDLFDLAYKQHMAGELDDAITLYQQSIEVHPTAEAHTYLGWVYGMQRRYEDAISECMQAIALDDGFGNPYNDIGSYLIELDRWDEAEVWLERAMNAPRYANRALPHINMARIRTQQGDLIGALREYKLAWTEDHSQLQALHAYQTLLTRLN